MRFIFDLMILFVVKKRCDYNLELFVQDSATL